MAPKNKLILVSLFISNIAFSETQHKLDTMTVVGTKTGETDLQVTPIAITLFDEQQIDEQGLHDISDLIHHSPGVSMGQNSSYGQIYIRGVGTNNVFAGADPSSIVHFDGVYMARPLTIFANFLDIERIEVLRGPQGTLYGRNAAGGTINIFSRLPGKTRRVKLSAEYAKFNHLRLSANVSGPIHDHLSAGISLLDSASDGYLENINTNGTAKLNDENKTGIAGKIRYWLSQRSELILSVDYLNVDETGPHHKALFRAVDGTLIEGPTVVDDPFKVNIPFQPSNTQELYGSHLKFLSDINGHLKFTSITAYRGINFHTIIDSDFTDADGLISNIIEEQKQFSQEFQINGTFKDFKWVSGLYYLEEDDQLIGDISLPSIAVAQGVSNFNSLLTTDVNTQAYAAFFQGTYALSPVFSATAGLRYSYEKKFIMGDNQLNIGGDLINNFNIATESDWEALTPKLGLDYQINKDMFTYFSISRGFKSGGFNGTSAADPAYNPEFLWAYEMGLKTDLMDNQLRFNSSIFYYDYTDLQVQQFLISEDGASRTVIENAADATVNGLEIELSATPLDTLRFDAALSYLDASYDNYITARTTAPSIPIDVSGNQLNSSPKFTANLTARYYQDLISGTVTYLLNYYWQSEEFYTPFNDKTTRQNDYGLLNTSIGYQHLNETFQLQIYANNLTNEAYFSSSSDFSPFGVTAQINPPRTFGIRLIYDFQ